MAVHPPALQGKKLKRKALGALRGARILLKLKLFWGHPFRSEKERQRGQDKLTDLDSILPKLEALGPNATDLKNPEALLQWSPLKTSTKTLAQLLNRHRMTQARGFRTTTLNIVLRALGFGRKATLSFDVDYDMDTSPQPSETSVDPLSPIHLTSTNDLLPAVSTQLTPAEDPVVSAPNTKESLSTLQPHSSSEERAVSAPNAYHLQGASQLFGLSSDLWRNKIFPFFVEDRDLVSLGQVNHLARHTTKTESDTRALKKLLHLAAYAGEPEQVKKILLAKPHLLLQTGDTRDPKGRLIKKKTALQIALANLDPEMATMIWDLFMDESVLNRLGINAEQAEELRTAQYLQQFPEPPTLVAKKPFNFTPLIDALSADDATDEIDRILGQKGNLEGLAETPLTKALQSFWEHFPEDGFREPQTGFFFPYGDYLAAENLYDNNYERWGSFDSPRNNAFARLILGGFHRRADARLAQILSFSLYEAAIEKKPAPRVFNFQYAKGSFFDFCSGPFVGFGAEYYCGAAARAARGWSRAGFRVRRRAVRHFFNKLSVDCQLTSLQPTEMPRPVNL